MWTGSGGEPWSIDALPILIPDWPKQPAKGQG